MSMDNVSSLILYVLYLNFVPSYWRYSMALRWWSMVGVPPAAIRLAGNMTEWNGTLSYTKKNPPTSSRESIRGYVFDSK